MKGCKDIFWIILLNEAVTAIKVNFVFVGIDDTAAYNSHIAGYISPAVVNVTFETVRNAYPELLADMQVISLVSDDTGNIGDDPCEIAIRAFPLFAKLFGREKDLFASISSDRITVVVAGEFCIDPNTDIGFFSSAADIVFLSSTVAVELSNISMFPTTINLYPTPPEIMFATLKAVLTLNNWTRFGILCGEDDVMYYWECTAGFQFYNFWDNQIAASNTYRPKLHTRDIETKTMDVLKDMQVRVRIIYIMALPKLLRRILIAAHSLNMTNGEYVFIAADRTPTYATPDLLHWQAVEDDGDESYLNDHKAFEGFKCTIITSDLGIHWDNLENFTRQSAQMSEVLLNRTIPVHGQRDIAAVVFLEVLLIFAQGLNRLLPNLDNMNPSQFVNHLLNHTYDLPSRQVSFFPDGKNVLSSPILRLNVSSGKFETAATYAFDTNVITILRPSLWAWFDGPFPPDVPPCGFDGNSCKALTLETMVPMAVVAVLICLTFLSAYIIRKKAELKIFSTILLENTHSDMSGSLTVPLGSSASKFSVMHNTKLRSIVVDMRRLSHPNIGLFYGISVRKESLSLVWELNERGNVSEVLRSRPVLRNEEILVSLVWDLLQGLIYVQNSPLQFHGAVHTDACFINHRYSLKLAKTGCFHLLECLGNQQSQPFPTLWEKTMYYRSDDVRNFGIVSQTILAHKKADVMPAEPASKCSEYEKWKRLTSECLQENAGARPSFVQLRKSLGKSRSPRNIAEYVIGMMDKQTQQLEVIVLEKTRILVEERHNADRLLAEILPRSIVHKLRSKEPTSPESFDCVSVLFSDIPQFSSLLSSCSPLDIISLLNQAYSEFDSIFGLYDAYKVETINDSYMLASGVPSRNGMQHATELCRLALHLLSSAETCLASHELAARIGINSGPVVAGVIGSKMPRYCLFGDTVNTASRMESSGEAGKIHVNESAQALAKNGNDLLFVPRGLITIKGKGEMTTFWLLSSTRKSQLDPEVDDPTNVS